MEAARLATTDDVDAIAVIDAAVRTEKQDQRGGSLYLRREAVIPAATRAEALLQSKTGIVVVGTFDGVPFGYALAEIEELEDGSTIGRIDDLAVVEEARKVGIGAAIMHQLLDHFRSAGCIGADARALPGDRHTKNFFESFGLKARMLTVHFDLTNEEG